MAEKIEPRNGYPKLVVRVGEYVVDGEKIEYPGVDELIISPNVSRRFWGKKVNNIYCDITGKGIVCQTEWTGDVVKPVKYIRSCSETHVWKSGRINIRPRSNCSCLVEEVDGEYEIICGENMWKHDPKSLLPFEYQLKLKDVEFEIEKVEERKIGDTRERIIVYRAKPKR